MSKIQKLLSALVYAIVIGGLLAVVHPNQMMIKT